jgi:DNA invertase Pin-like site-specific DNA recombinase
MILSNLLASFIAELFRQTDKQSFGSANVAEPIRVPVLNHIAHELRTLLTQLRTGDTVYIYKLDRLGRSLKHLLQVVGDFQQLGVGLVSLTDAINTTSAQGRLVFNLFASLAEFERELIRERTHAGLAAARARGRVGGRQRGLSEQAERTAIIAETLYREQQLGVNEIAQRLNISKVTLYKYLRHRKVVIHAHRKTAAAKAAD